MKKMYYMWLFLGFLNCQADEPAKSMPRPKGRIGVAEHGKDKTPKIDWNTFADDIMKQYRIQANISYNSWDTKELKDIPALKEIIKQLTLILEEDERILKQTMDVPK